jgi:hypothetical protein
MEKKIDDLRFHYIFIYGFITGVFMTLIVLGLWAFSS